MIDRALARQATAELVGTALLVAIVIGSGISAQRLSPHDVGLQLLENSIATGAGLVALILAFGPVSGAHFNPVVTLADRLLGTTTSANATTNANATRNVSGNATANANEITTATANANATTNATRSATANIVAVVYVIAQIVGGCVGAMVANLMFDLDAITISNHARSSSGLWFGEFVATLGLLVVIFGVVRSGRASAAPFAVGGYIAAAYWFTSSTSFANPAVTIARMLSDTFAGIAPSSAPAFVAVQVVGALVAVALIKFLYPTSVPPS